MGFPLDYLVQLAAHCPPQVAVGDLDLLEKVQIVGQSGDEDRELVKKGIELVVMQSQMRRLAGCTSFGALTEAWRLHHREY